MSYLDGRVAIVTGAGRGLGRCHALELARAGAMVLVNDLGSDVTGQGKDMSPAQAVATAIQAAGGVAAVSGHDVSDWTAAEAMIALAVEKFGRLDVLVNNAGILRDRTLARMSEQEWDSVVAVHLKGHAAPTRHALAYWQQCAKAGEQVRASIIQTSSASGLVGNFGQANYGSAKLGVVALSSIVNLEAGRYGVRSNVVAPAASTRMAAMVAGEPEPAGLEPDRVSPLVGWLAAAECPAAGQVFQVHGRRIVVLALPAIAANLLTADRWTFAELQRVLPPHLVTPLVVDDLVPPGDLGP